ncbi:sugar porter family MFS transporter [Lysobacter sp. A6]|uniref:Sugar porter family MFS transporter n=1 Tax=Noviluteimonas lactosilytica TaxID=2888523 RepID=A0ABS8JJ92_9GAMM|nr:sugar porter family MFS transporter [Lysobacter lactosilyticus]MCC8363672.1 sugar porter family MFS transporter [Lysobacter lactosilyticus]
MSTAAPPIEQHATMRVLLITAAAALGGFLFGYDTAVINGAVDAIRGEFGLSAVATGVAVSCALVGSAIGAWYAGPLADRFGRVSTMRVAAALLAISALGAGLAFGVWDLIFWRIVGGIGVGVASVIAPTYIAEVSPAHVRGRLGSMQQLAIVLGIFASLLADAWLANTAGGAAQPLWLGMDAWRWMFLVAVVPALIYGALVFGVPESPRHLVAKGRFEEAKRVLRDVLDLRNEGALDAKLADIRNSLRTEYVPRLSDLRGPRMGLLPIVWVGILLSVFQQFVGINVIFYYSSTLWHSVGFSESDAFSITVATSIVNVLVTLVAIALVDKVGRKPLLLVGSAGMAVTLGLMAVAFSHATGTGASLTLPGNWGPTALVAANLYVVFFGLSWGPMVWVLLGEMFPNRIRAIALAVAASAQWIANFVITATFPSLAEMGLTFAYGLYAAFAVISFVFVQRAVRETKGMELEAMTD